jgi:hypothetical protein
MGTFTSGGFSNLMAAAPLCKENKHELVLSLIGDLNNLYATGISVEPIVDCFLDEELFETEPEHKKPLLLVGSSHPRCIAEQLDTSKWGIFDLCSGGFRITDHSVAEIMTKVDTLKRDEVISYCTAIIQLYDKSVYQVGRPGGTQHLPIVDNSGRYHADGPLLTADKPGIWDLTCQLTPQIKVLGGTRKIFLMPIARCCLKPCCQDEAHGGMWGPDPVHPSEEGYRVIVVLSKRTRTATRPDKQILRRCWWGTTRRGPVWSCRNPGRSGSTVAPLPCRDMTLSWGGE